MYMEVGRGNGLFAYRLSRSLKVIGTDMDRSATYDPFGSHLVPFPRQTAISVENRKNV